LAPSVDAQGQQFNFNPDQQQPPSQGFEFWIRIGNMRGKKEESSLLCVVLCVSSFFLRLITYLGVIDFFEEADLFFL
jgi:hypothetical protein